MAREIVRNSYLLIWVRPAQAGTSRQ